MDMKKLETCNPVALHCAVHGMEYPASEVEAPLRLSWCLRSKIEIVHEVASLSYLKLAKSTIPSSPTSKMSMASRRLSTAVHFEGFFFDIPASTSKCSSMHFVAAPLSISEFEPSRLGRLRERARVQN